MTAPPTIDQRARALLNDMEAGVVTHEDIVARSDQLFDDCVAAGENVDPAIAARLVREFLRRGIERMANPGVTS